MFRRSVLAVVPLLLTLAACSSPQKPDSKGKDETGPKASGKPVTLTVGHVGHDHQLALYVAALEGDALIRKFGVGLKEVKAREVYDLVEGDTTVARLRLVKVGGGAEMPTAMARGDIQVGLGGTVPVAKVSDKGENLKILCPLQTDGDMLVMKKGLDIKDWQAFIEYVGKQERPVRIGYKSPTAVAKMVFERALKEEKVPCGLDPESAKGGVLLVNFSSEKSPLALLEKGGIDGYVMNQPSPAMAEETGLGDIVCQLRDLPPRGKWVDHPCCCVAARAEVVKENGSQLKALMKVLLAATQCIQDDQALAIRSAKEWIKTPGDVEKRSVPTVTYVAEPTDTWVKGMRTWKEMMDGLTFFKGRYAKMTTDQFMEDLCSLDLCRQAARELREKKLLKGE